MPWKRIEPMNQRIEFVLRAMQTDNFRALCRECGISPKKGYKWKKRFEREQLKGMQALSRRPRSSPGGLGEEVVCEIIRIKQKHLAWGPRKIRPSSGRQHTPTPTESSCTTVLERAGYTEKPR